MVIGIKQNTMKIYNTIGDYLKNRKAGDIVVFEGHGIIDGLKVGSKYDTYKVLESSTDDEIEFKAYGCRGILGIHEHLYNQKVGVLSKVEFKNLPV